MVAELALVALTLTVAAGLTMLAGMLQRLEATSPCAPALAELVARLLGGGAPPSRAIHRLGRLLATLDARRNMILGPISPLLLWGTQCALAIEDLLNLMIFGIHNKAGSLADMYRLTVLAWLHTGSMMVRYEDLVKHANALATPEAEAYFRALLDHCRIAMPGDWAERVAIGADRKQSSTARENLSLGTAAVPDILPEGQKQLVDVAMPGLRAILGYA